MEIDVTSCVYYDTDEGICFNKNCLTKYCDGYECLFKKYHKAIAENKELKEMVFVAESALMKQNKIYRQVLHDIEEIINNFAGTDIITLPDLSKEKNYKLIAEQYAEPIKQIIQKIKEVNE